jgi:Flp pilus assembly pilin Flp
VSSITRTLEDLARRAWIRVRHEEGQTLIEYALLAFLIAIAAILFLSAIGLDLAETFDKVENSLGIGATNDATAGGISDVSAKTGVN